MRSLVLIALIPVALAAKSDLDLRGATVNPAEFRYARPIPAVPRGLVRLQLDADVLAHSRELADVRVLDRRNAQIPYVVDRFGPPLVISLKIPSRVADQRRSVYRVALPYDTLPPQTKIVFATSARVFSREVELRRSDNEAARDRRSPLLATASWSSTDPDHAPPELTFNESLAGLRSVELVVDDGDNAPLPITSAKLELPSAALRFFHPGTPLTLVYGNPSATEPRYDLALLAARVFAAPAREVTLPASRSARPELTAPAVKLFWVAVAVAALLLFAVLARLIAGRAASE